jgi:hypothetical protein
MDETARVRRFPTPWSIEETRRVASSSMTRNGYLEAAFPIVSHYKTRRRTNKLLRHAFKFANPPFDKAAAPLTAVIRCSVTIPSIARRSASGRERCGMLLIARVLGRG